MDNSPTIGTMCMCLFHNSNSSIINTVPKIDLGLSLMETDVSFSKIARHFVKYSVTVIVNVHLKFQFISDCTKVSYHV
jgi:hypothetical protein